MNEIEKRLSSLKEAIKEYERFRTLSDKEKEMLYKQCENGTFMDLSYDWSFKHLMQDKDILLMLLNDILPEKKRNAGDLIHIYLLELLRLKKNSMAGLSPLEGWLYSLKNLHTFAASPEGMDPRFGRVVDAARLMHLPEGEQLQYYRAMLSESEKKAYYGGGYQQGVMKGHDEGFAEGQQSGREDASIEIARRMREAGADAAYIKAMTGIAISD